MPTPRWFVAIVLGLHMLPAAAGTCADGSITERVLCLADRAEAAGDPLPCENAADARVRDQCYGVFAVRTGQPGACRAIAGETRRERSLRQICLSDVAIVTGNADLCAEIEHDGLRDTCNLKLYRDTGNAALCDRIEAPSLRDLCGA